MPPQQINPPDGTKCVLMIGLKQSATLLHVFRPDTRDSVESIIQAKKVEWFKAVDEAYEYGALELSGIVMGYINMADKGEPERILSVVNKETLYVFWSEIAWYQVTEVPQKSGLVLSLIHI